jgi:hypothetical protein
MNKKMKIYKKPILKTYGNLKNITKGAGSTYDDADQHGGNVVS